MGLFCTDTVFRHVSHKLSTQVVIVVLRKKITKKTDSKIGLICNFFGSIKDFNQKKSILNLAKIKVAVVLAFNNA